MTKNEKISLAIFVILLIIFAVNLWAGKIGDSKTKKSCETACVQIRDMGWMFPGMKPGNPLSSRENCVSACQARFKK